VKRIAILTAGADAPGANAAIRSIVRSAYHMDMEVLGVRGGFAGLLSDDVIILTSKSVSGILPRVEPYWVRPEHALMKLKFKQ